MQTTQFTWATDKESKMLMQMNPPTTNDVQEMMVAAIERGDAVLCPVDCKRKSSCAEAANPSEPDDVLRLMQPGE